MLRFTLKNHEINSLLTAFHTLLFANVFFLEIVLNFIINFYIIFIILIEIWNDIQLKLLYGGNEA